jgi:hypothetical protein
VVGYPGLLGADEEGTRERVKWILRELVDPKIQHRQFFARSPVRSRLFRRPAHGRNAKEPTPFSGRGSSPVLDD